jgi:7-carboxy-7-deazaguanine synthase
MLRITEIFYSLQGETRTMGFPTVFIRLTGCPLRCQYCDTAYAFHGGERLDMATILAKVKAYQPRYVTVTGGEPLAQKECISLLRILCDAGYQVSLETSGAMSVCDVDPRVIKVIDIKTPGSNEVDKNYLDNLHYMQPHDQLKFVICDRNDYEWSKVQLATLPIPPEIEILFSPSYGQMNPRDLADWLLADKLAVRFQIQLHKMLWGDVPGV